MFDERLEQVVGKRAIKTFGLFKGRTGTIEKLIIDNKFKNYWLKFDSRLEQADGITIGYGDVELVSEA